MPSSHLLGLSYIFLVTIIWSGASFLIQHLYREFEFRSPFLLTYISSSLFVVLLPTRLLWEQIITPLISTTRSRSCVVRRKCHMLIGKGATPQSGTASAYRSVGTDDLPISFPQIVNDENDDENYNRQPEVMSSPVERNIKKTTTTTNNNECQTTRNENNRDDFNEIIEERDDQPQHSSSSSQRIDKEERDDATNDNVDDHLQNTTILPKTPPPPPTTTPTTNKPLPTTPPPLTHHQTLLLSLRIAPLLFLTNYTYNLSLAHTSLSSATVLANTGSLFTCLFAVGLGDERFSFVKLTGVMLCLMGGVIVGRGDVMGGEEGGEGVMFGDLAGLVSAMGYGGYTMMIRLCCPKDDVRLSMPLLFGYVGLCIFVGLSPVALVLSFREDAGLTRTIVYYLIIKGLLDNVISDYLWARAVVLSGATTATVGLGLTIPLAFLGDWVVNGGVVPERHAVMGAVVVLVGFVFVNVGGVWDGRGVGKWVGEVGRWLWRVVVNQNLDDIRIHVGLRSSKKLR